MTCCSPPHPKVQLVISPSHMPRLSRVGRLNTQHTTSSPSLLSPLTSSHLPTLFFTPEHTYHIPMTCTGASKDNTACLCTLFIPKKSKGAKCKTCGHRLSYHSDNQADLKDFKTPVPAKAPGDKYVTRLFKSLEATAVHETAREEMLQGFRPPFTQADVCMEYTLFSIP